MLARYYDDGVVGPARQLAIGDARDQRRMAAPNPAPPCELPARAEPVAMHYQRCIFGPVVLELGDPRRRAEYSVVRDQVVGVVVGDDAGHDVADAAETHTA